MTEREKELRRSDRLRLSVILGLCMILAVPVVVAMAASPDPSATTAATASAEASTPATTEAPPAATVAPVAPRATDKPSTLPKKNTDKLERGFGAGKGAITIAAINGSKLSLKTVDGWTRTITVTAATTIRKGGQAITLADLDVGDPIRFAQKRNDDGTYTITAIQIPTPKTAGEVTAISGNSLTIKRRNGKTQTITLNDSTLYKVGDAKVTKSAVKVGSRVTIQGTTSGEAFTATTVHVQPTVVAGEVTAKTSTSLTLKRRDGSSIVVHVSADTKYRVRGSKTAGLADLVVGDAASAVGMLRSDGSLDASAVQEKHKKGNKGNKDADPNKAPAASTTPG
jgi:hypothetical protein